MVKRKADDSDAADALAVASAAAEAALASAGAEPRSGSIPVGVDATGAADDVPMPALNAAGAGVPGDAAAAADLLIAEAAAAAALRQEEAERAAAAAMASGAADLQPKKRQRMTWLGEFVYMYIYTHMCIILSYFVAAPEGL